MNQINHRHTLFKLLLYSLCLPLAAWLFVLAPAAAFAQDKSGVKPQVISLPSGPGSLEGLGENFEPNLSTGTSSYPVKFTAAPGRVGFQPEVSLDYNGGNANGPWGMGWALSIPSIQRRTEDGLPTYNDAQAQFIYSGGEKLVALKDGSYRFENESSFMRFRRVDSGGWEAQTPAGIRFVFGETANARVENVKGIFRWELERVIDTHGNEMQYSYLHDGDYGNQTQAFNFGRVCGTAENPDVTCGDDEILKYTEYIYDDARYIFNRVQRIYQTDAAGNVVSEVKLYYDGEPFVGLPLGQLTRGDLTREESNLGPNAGNRMIATKRYQVDEYGNQIAMKDANGNLVTVVYDPTQHTFPVQEQRHFADGHRLTYAASYHPGFGQVTAATDYNGHPHIFTYDTFGRLAKMVKPGDTLEMPTEAYSYTVGSPRSSVKTQKRVRSGEAAVLTTITYTDGLGRKVQTRSDAGNGQVVVTEAVTFNARQGVRDKYLPYFSTGLEYAPPAATSPRITQHYDVLGRVVRTINPDDTVSSVVYKPLVQELYDEEDNGANSAYTNTPQILTYDGLERLIGVAEQNRVDGQLARYQTHYAYDTLGKLTQITDAQNHIKRMEYDALGRRLRMVDPDKGEMRYTYDDNGNLIKTRDAKGQAVHYTYDAANRPLREVWSFSNGQADVVNVVYHYDMVEGTLGKGARNTLGQLAYTINNPLKYQDPTGARPERQLLIVPLKTGDGSHPRMAVVFNAEIPDYGRYGPRTTETIRAKMFLITQRGDQWVRGPGEQTVTLKFTQTPNTQTKVIPGMGRREVYDPQTVKSSALCVGNMCAVASRASGGKYLTSQMQVRGGKYELLSEDRKSSTDLSVLDGSTQARPFVFVSGELSNMPAQYGVAPGVGVNLNGGNVEDFSHIITGGTSFGSLQQGPSLQKAEKPKN